MGDLKVSGEYDYSFLVYSPTVIRNGTPLVMQKKRTVLTILLLKHPDEDCFFIFLFFLPQPLSSPFKFGNYPSMGSKKNLTGCKSSHVFLKMIAYHFPTVVNNVRLPIPGTAHDLFLPIALVTNIRENRV